MRFVEHPDVARLRVNPSFFGRGRPQTAAGTTMGFLGVRPGKVCDPPCPGQICCASGACVDSIAGCLALTSGQRRPGRGRSKSLRRNNPRTIADRLLGIFNLHPRR
jgi:hypothetical protein